MSQLIPGLSYVPDYLEPETHDRLLADVDSHPWLTSVDHRVQIYGYTYNHAKRAALRIADLPEWAKRVADRLWRDGLVPTVPDQLVVNDYPPGTGIFSHIDQDLFGDTVVSVSLASTCIIEFVSPESGRKQELLLEPRSALVLSGEARWQWRHGIPPRTTDYWRNAQLDRRRRVSLTFRIMPTRS